MASAWTTPHRLASDAQAPIYGSDASGRFYALFARPSGAGYAIYFDRLGRRGGRGTATQLDSPSSPAGGEYALALAPSGAGLAVWCSVDPAGQMSPGVYAAIRAPGGAFGHPQQLAAPVPSTGLADGCSVRAGAGSSGGMVAAWRRTGAPGDELEAAVGRAGARRLGAAQRLDSDASGSSFPFEAAVDGSDRATIAWVGHGTAFAARETVPGGALGVAPAAAGACASAGAGARPLRLASADSGASLLVTERCEGSRRVLEVSRAAPGRAFGHTQRIASTPNTDTGLVMNRAGQFALTWRSASGHLYAGTGRANAGVRHSQRLTAPRPAYRPGIDTQSSAIDARGHVLVAWRQRSLRRGAAVVVRISNVRGRFGRQVRSFAAPGSVGVNAAMSAAGAAAVAWSMPSGRTGASTRIVTLARRSGRVFKAPRTVVRGHVEPTGLTASGHLLLLTWVTQPDLVAFSSVGSFAGR